MLFRSVNLDGVPDEYHDFADVFSKTKAGVLADHCPYDLKITLEEGASPPPLDPSIRYLRKNYSPFVSSLMKTQPQDSFVPHGLPMERLYSSYARHTEEGWIIAPLLRLPRDQLSIEERLVPAVRLTKILIKLVVQSSKTYFS